MHNAVRCTAVGLLCLALPCVGYTQQILSGRTLAAGDSVVVPFDPPAGIPIERLGLALDARLDAKSWAGSALALQIRLAGRAVSGERIANKPMTFATVNGRLATWANGNLWRVVYSPDFDLRRNAKGDPHQVLEVAPFHLEIRIGDLVQPGSQRLVLVHAGPRLPSMELRDVHFVKLEASVDQASKGSGSSSDAGARRIVVPKPGASRLPLALEPIRASENVHGKFGERAFELATTVGDGHGGWQRPEALGKELRLTRTVRIVDGTVLGHDVLSNRGHADTGLVVRYSVSRTPQSTVFLGGTALPPQPVAVSQIAPQAPSAVAVDAAGCIGILPASDVLWVHAATFRDATSIGLMDGSLCLAAGDSVALDWRLIGTTGGYFDWLNVARDAIGANFTLTGGFAFGSFAMVDWPAERLKAWIEMRRLRYVSSPAPTASGSHGLHGAALLDDPAALARMRAFAAAIHRASPDVRVIAYFHAFLCNRNGALERYGTTAVRNVRGDVVAYPYRDHPLDYQLFLPIVGSPFATDLEKLIASLFELGFDGLYWDEMSGSVTPWTYGTDWDHASADIDPKLQQLVRRKSSLALLAQPWIDATLTRLEADGRALVANTEPVTVTLQRHRFPRFVESAEDAQLCLAQLWSPIALGDRVRERTAGDVAARIVTHLEHGLLYYYYSPAVTLASANLARYMFPVTPLRIDAGMILAPERILTTRSGTYGWGDASQCEAHVFGIDGTEITPPAIRTFEIDGQRCTDLHLESGQAAVLVRHP